MKRFTRSVLSALLLGLSALLSEPAEAQAPLRDCRLLNQPGDCMTFQIFLATYDPRHPVMQELQRSTNLWAKGGVDLPLNLYKDVKQGHGEFYAPCAKATVFTWKTNMSVPVSSMRTYDALRRGKQPGQEIDLKSEPLLEGRPANDVFGFDVCDGLAAIQMPWAYLPEGSEMIICLDDVDLVFPPQNPSIKGPRRGIRFTVDDLNHLRSTGGYWVMTAWLAHRGAGYF